MKLITAITGVPDGEIYPREIEVGEECPENLLAYAESLGAIETAEQIAARDKAAAEAAAKEAADKAEAEAKAKAEAEAAAKEAGGAKK